MAAVLGLALAAAGCSDGNKAATESGTPAATENGSEAQSESSRSEERRVGKECRL